MRKKWNICLVCLVCLLTGCRQEEDVTFFTEEVLQQQMSSVESGIQEAVSSLMKLPAEKRKEMGESARDYVNQQKNPKVQCQKLGSW